MGLRDTIRERVFGAIRGVGKRIQGPGPYAVPGQGMGARTTAWPPGRMGSGPEVKQFPHPADLAAAGETISSADLSSGRWPDPPKKVPSAPAKPETPPTGSIPQQDWLPVPKDPPPAPPAADPIEPPAADEGPDEDLDKPAPPAKSFSADPPTADEKTAIEEEVVKTLKTIFDPEIPVDIYELGLIYDVDLGADRTVEITMTLTSPNCPAAQSLPAEVEVKSASVEGVAQAMVDIVWEPPWGPERMSEAARLELNID